ncbi:MAG: hypothetical protein HQL37_15380, partial [Alphaproteobacteria bacterium]|nr:hypothetical protein [Alphaproteobacteria bacterium]
MGDPVRRNSPDSYFETKVRELVQITRSCSVSQVLALRHRTLNDLGALGLDIGNYFRVIFKITAKHENLGEPELHQAQRDKFESLLPPVSATYGRDQRENDRVTLGYAAIQSLATLFSEAIRRAEDPAFEGKVHELVLITRAYSVAQILALRHETLDDPASRAWGSVVQIKVIFNVVLTFRLQSMGEKALREAQESNFETLLPPMRAGYMAEKREEDRETIANAVMQALAVVVYSIGMQDNTPGPVTAVSLPARSTVEPFAAVKPLSVPPAAGVSVKSPKPTPAPV